jgi:hypothetical protein
MSAEYKQKTRRSASRTPAKASNLWAWVVLTVILLTVTLIRVRMLSIPLERDEGEFAYMGQLMLDGIPPYKIAYNMKLPGIYAAYALVMAVFGQTIVAIHLGLLLVNLTAIVLVFLLGKRLVDSLAAVVAAAVYGINSAGMCILGASAHATHFVLPFALGGMLLMLKGAESKKPYLFFLSGLLLGMGLLMKQHAALFIAFAALYILWTQARPISWKSLVRQEVLLMAGSAIPFAVTCLILYRAGVFGKFWFWCFTYAKEYATEMPAKAIWSMFSDQITRTVGRFGWLWVLGGLGLIIVFLDGRLREKRAFLAGFALFAFLAACPGFYFRQHYFVPFLSAVALLTGVAVSSSWRMLSRWRYTAHIRGLPLALLAIALFYAIVGNRSFWLELSPTETCRVEYGANPFPEMIEVAKYLKAHTSKNDSIAVLGSEPETFFYAHRRSATGFIYTYGLMENQKYAHQMQKQMILEIESARPKYVVFVSCPTSWLARDNSDMTVFEWAGEFVRKRYELVGIVDFLARDSIPFFWDEAVKGYWPMSSSYICVYRRKD